MKKLVIFLVFVFSSPCDAQLISVQGAPLATKDDVAAAQATLAAAMPSNCNAVPSPDTLMGSTSSAPCYSPASATRPSKYQSTTVFTDASGNFSGTWSRSFVSSTPSYDIPQLNGLFGTCSITGGQASFSGKCIANNVSIVGSLVTVTLGLTASNSKVTVTAREPTQ